MNAAVLKKLSGLALALIGAGAVPSAWAAQTWDFSNTGADNSGYNANGCARTGGYGNTVTCDRAPTAPVTATVTGWVTTGTATSSTFVTGYLNNQGGNGIGMQDRSEDVNVSPYHAIDSKGNTELVAIRFSESISLQQVTLGWAEGDSDFSVLAWTDTSRAPTLSSDLGGKTPGGLIGSGWTLVGNFSNVIPGATTNGSTVTSSDTNGSVSFNTTGNIISSSYWLIGAFNSTYGGPAGIDNVADAWKLISVAGNSPKIGVPEPGSLALVGLALLGAAGARRARPAASPAIA